MRTAQPDKRTRLIETATNLAYGRGFRETSLADIAEAARVPVGNVYYYFKTKEELAEAVVERLLEEFRAARAEWDRLGAPKERLLAFVSGIQANRSDLRVEDVHLAACAPSCTRRAALSRRNPRRSLLSPSAGLRSSSGPPATIRTHVNLQCISSPPFRGWPPWRTARMNPIWC